MEIFPKKGSHGNQKEERTRMTFSIFMFIVYVVSIIGCYIGYIVNAQHHLNKDLSLSVDDFVRRIYSRMFIPLVNTGMLFILFKKLLQYDANETHRRSKRNHK